MQKKKTGFMFTEKLELKEIRASIFIENLSKKIMFR